MIKIPSRREARKQELITAITDLKQHYEDRLVILSHHYQREEIVSLGHFKGDSYALSEWASQQEKALYIVFCGVHFMAESAKILAQSHQKVFLPNMNAGCPMADMAEEPVIGRCWDELHSVIDGNSTVIPLTYMNSNAAVKAFTGIHGGAVCTSSNARRAFQWAFQQGDKILFIPDEHLGRNTANGLNIPRGEVVLWDPTKPLGGLEEETLRNAKVILWKGYCHVHTWFTLKHIEEARLAYPKAKIIVHPECREEVVNQVDGNGSTGFIVKYVKDAPPGTEIIIGTEINLISRLAKSYPDKRIMELSRSLCPNMFRITLQHLHRTLQTMETDNSNEIIIPTTHVEGAKLALDRMLSI